MAWHPRNANDQMDRRLRTRVIAVMAREQAPPAQVGALPCGAGTHEGMLTHPDDVAKAILNG